MNKAAPLHCEESRWHSHGSCKTTGAGEALGSREATVGSAAPSNGVLAVFSHRTRGGSENGTLVGGGCASPGGPHLPQSRSSIASSCCNVNAFRPMECRCSSGTVTISLRRASEGTSGIFCVETHCLSRELPSDCTVLAIMLRNCSNDMRLSRLTLAAGCPEINMVCMQALWRAQVVHSTLPRRVRKTKAQGAAPPTAPTCTHHSNIRVSTPAGQVQRWRCCYLNTR